MAPSLQQLVSQVVQERFRGVAIDRVEVMPDVDHDGDPVLRITVVFDAEIEDVDVDELVGWVRHLRPKLLERGEEAFPITRFMTKRDYDSLRHEAA